jgi:hypothetical protein
MSVTYDLTRFRLASFHTSKAHVPPGGLGCFYGEYNPMTGIMKVTVKVTPRFFTPMGDDVTTTTEAAFMKAFKEGVPQTWNNKFRFTLTKRGFAGIVVKPEFAVEETALTDAHYDLKIVNSRRGAICVRTEEDPSLAKLTDHKWDPYRGKLSAQFSMKAMEAAELTQAENILNAMALKPVEIAVSEQQGTSAGASYSVVAMERLRTFARDTNVVFENSGKTPKVTITGPGATGKDTAKSVGGILTKFGLKAKLSYEKNGEAGKGKIQLDVAQLTTLKARVLGNVGAFPQFGQHAIVHEYGHMLGLPDEYMCVSAGTIGLVGQLGLGSRSTEESDALTANTTTDQQQMTPGIERSQVEFVKLCQAFGVPAPPFGRSNPSIMSSGTQIQPCHGVTVAHALWRMARHYSEMADWRIDVT